MKNNGSDTLGFLLHDSARLIRKRFEDAGREHGLSAAQWRALVRVVKDEGISQVRLADLLEIEPISVSRLLDRMEEGGWIERRPDPADRRVRLIFATEKSRSAFAEIKSMAGEVYACALHGLSSEEQAALITGLQKLIANLSAAETFGQIEKREGVAA